MSFAAPEFRIPRQSVVGVEGEWCKMFDPPTESPATPELIPPNNPVPRFMRDTIPGVTMTILNTVRLTLLHGTDITMWDGNKVRFFTFASPDIPATAAGTYPAMTIRVPRGVLFHGWTHGEGPPPHTIHWHGIEPTAINDGVGHCSMEIGTYIYQWQPNFIGSYFYHCHRNTMQHFEFGLYGLMPFGVPDAWWASIDVLDPVTGVVSLNNIPIGASRDGKYRTQANLKAFPQFPDFIGGDPVNGVYVPDPWTGNPLHKFLTDPHAFTVAYEHEAIWVFDDRDSNWSELAPDPFATFPEHGSVPGVNDKFYLRQGVNGFFAFNDFNADYWYCTGVPFPGPKGGSATLPTGNIIPPQVNGGIVGSMVDINIGINQTLFLRCLDGAYDPVRVTMPVDMVIIEWDGRALGVPPFGRYNRPILVKANTPFFFSVARRFGALIRSATPVNAPAKVEFLNPRGLDVVFTGFIPIHIN